MSYVGYQRYFLTFCTAFRHNQLTGYAHHQAHGNSLWQAGYHERVLRDDETTEAVARYILANPVRAGLSRQVGDYGFAGSFVYDMKALLTAWDGQT